MRTTVLNHFHTFHPEAQAEFDRLALEEKRLTTILARRGEEWEPPKKQRASAAPQDVEAELTDVRKRMDECRETIKSGVVRIIVKGLSRGEFRRLLSEHPAREGDPLDERMGYNSDTFGDAFIQACIVRCEDLDGQTVPTDWDTWADEMTNGQWEECFTACLKLTNNPNPVFPR